MLRAARCEDRFRKARMRCPATRVPASAGKVNPGALPPQRPVPWGHTVFWHPSRLRWAPRTVTKGKVLEGSPRGCDRPRTPASIFSFSR